MPAGEWNPEQAIAGAPSRHFAGTVWRVHWREILATDWSLSLRSSGRYHRVLDLSDPETVGLTAADLTGPDFRICQSLAAAAMARGDEGLLVPSAALVGLNLVILPQNLPEPSPIRMLRSEDLPLDAMAQERDDTAE